LAVEGNIDPAVVQGFGDEWTRFDQRPLAENDLRDMFNDFFSIFPWGVLPPDAEGYDVGCGSGRWARFVAPRVGRLHCIDPSAPALAVARRGLERHPNCLFHLASVDDMPLADGSMDFGYALGVLHHLPDPEAGLRSCVSKLKAGAPFLLYLYYAFDNRPRWFRFTWRVSNVFRQAISRLPYTLRYGLSQLIAGTVYYPWARLALLLERLGFTNVAVVPLAWYRRRSFYTMRTDALDRFGTRLEKRFSAQEIACMMERAGLDRISFSPSMPFWCAVGYKKGAADIGKRAALRESATA
jgi:SAM-dependent methyltransferase